MSKEVWDKEYQIRNNMPSTKSRHASPIVYDFLLQFPDIKKSMALDAGSGNGRNSIYLAEVGFDKVVGVDYSPAAIDLAWENAEKAGIADKVEFVEQNLGEPLHMQDNYFDLIIDIRTMYCLTESERDVYCKEVERVLKPGGYFLFYTKSAESPDVKVHVEISPGPEVNSYQFKVNEDTVLEKAFTKEELTDSFSKLEIVKLENTKEESKNTNAQYSKIYFIGIMRKPL